MKFFPIVVIIAAALLLAANNPVSPPGPVPPEPSPSPISDDDLGVLNSAPAEAALVYVQTLSENFAQAATRAASGGEEDDVNQWLLGANKEAKRPFSEMLQAELYEQWERAPEVYKEVSRGFAR